jgi:large subunit ribosomal protein L10
LSFAKDPVAAAKAVANYAKENDKFVIIGAVFNQKLLSVSDVKKLAALPSLDELRAKLLAVISAPAQKLATVISQPGAGLARVVAAYSKKS